VQGDRARREGLATMKLSHRRQILHLVVGAAALPATMGAARAQAYPTRPIANRFRRPRWRNGQP
jgi:hypothetical protein